MKYICFGYLDTKRWATLSEGEQNATIDECFAYDDVLKKNGHWVGGEGLQGPENAATLRRQNGKTSVTDGPYAEGKEHLGGFVIIKAPDLDAALGWARKQAEAVRLLPIEVRPFNGEVEG